MSNILVVAAHPDDEILGVGATVAKRVAQGDVARAVILGEGQTSRWKNREETPPEVLEKLHHDTIQAAEIIGYEKVYFADFPDNRFDHVDLLDIVKYVEKVIQEFSPEVIYTHHGGDLNIDHQMTYKAVLTATRPVGNYPVKEIYTFETLSSTEWDFSYQNPFRPNMFEDVEHFLEKKLEAMKCYESELCDFPHPRSLEGMCVTAKKYGSVVGKAYVEAFMAVRVVR